MASYPAQLEEPHPAHDRVHQARAGADRHLDYPDVASLAMPSALLVINGSKDGLFDLDGVRGCFAKLSACYAKAGVAEKFRGRLYDTPHEFNPRCSRRRGVAEGGSEARIQGCRARVDSRSRT